MNSSFGKSVIQWTSEQKLTESRHKLRLSRQFHSIAMKIELIWAFQARIGNNKKVIRCSFSLLLSPECVSHCNIRAIYTLQTIACNSPLVVIVLNGMETIEDYKCRTSRSWFGSYSCDRMVLYSGSSESVTQMVGVQWLLCSNREQLI